MRVIAGEHRGRKLVAPDTDATRPIMDRAKESIFNSISSEVPGARVLDLFAGVGSFGIEAMSRGAASVVFVEWGRKALDALRTNLETLEIDATIRSADVLTWEPAAPATFDLVFCDPPWPMSAETIAETLDRLSAHFEVDAIVVSTRRAKDPTPEPVSLRIDDERTMGGTRIIRYRKELS